MTDTHSTLLSPDIVAKFWSKVDRSGDRGACWTWRGRTNRRRNGAISYGAFSVTGKDYSSHRLSWLLSKGDIPDGLCVCHRCDNVTCVNPDHLFLGTQSENMRDCISKGRDKILHGLPGESHGYAKLTEGDVLEIRRLLASGVSCASLGRQYRVNQKTIYWIQIRRNWKHLP
jgi:hypothetical protein